MPETCGSVGLESRSVKMEGKSKSSGFCGWFLAVVILALVVGAIVYTVMKKTGHSRSDKPEPVPGPPGAIDQKYASALKTAMQFFDIQKCKLSCYRI